MFQYFVMTVMLLIAIYSIYIGLKSRLFFLLALSALQSGVVLWLFLFSGRQMIERVNVQIDMLTIIMLLIVGLVGGLICVCSWEYMKEYHLRNPHVKDNRLKFFSFLILSIFAMFGLVIFSNLTLMLLFLQTISLCSFFLIGYIKSSKAEKSSFTALTFNVFGDFCFAVGIILLAVYEGVFYINAFVLFDYSSPVVMSAVLLIACAGLVKAAQLPFSKWMLNATETPAPVLAILHSVTMVNAGVYLILRLTPMLGSTAAGVSITFVGGITFIVAAALAGSQYDARKMLAYSTVSALGLIVVCAGLNTPAAQWAAIMLLILHTVAKSLLFLSFGSAEHQPGERDVEHMRGMHGMSMRLAMFLIIGMAGMLVAPFVMLLSRWPAMQAVIVSGNILIVMIIAFGSTVTLFFWTKWIGKLIAHVHLYDREEKYPTRFGETFGLFTLAAFVLIVCMLYPLVSEALVVPFIRDSMKVDYGVPILPEELSAIFLMLAMLLVIPIILIPYFKKHWVKRAPTYLAGVNSGDDLTYRGAMGQTRRYELRNRYLIPFLNERKSLMIAYIICIVIIIGGFFVTMGGAIL